MCRGLQHWAWPGWWPGGTGSLERVQEAREAFREGGSGTWRHAWHLLQVSEDQPYLLTGLLSLPGPGGYEQHSRGSHLLPWVQCLQDQDRADSLWRHSLLGLPRGGRRALGARKSTNGVFGLFG